jgi:four helix bundle protein
MQNEECRMQNEENPDDLRARTKQYALRVIKCYTALPKDTVAQILGRQLLRSGTSVGAHYREATRARSVAEFVSKMEGGLQEADESAYWPELLSESNVVAQKRLAPLMEETGELLAIFAASVITAKRKRHY